MDHCKSIIEEVMNMKKIALIPAYEPDEKLTATIAALRKMGYEIIVVNDGSGASYDRIFHLSEIDGASVITHNTNRGKGAAIKTGLFYIKLHYDSPYTVVTVDADGQHRPDDVESVVQESKAYPDSLILGCRHFTGAVPLRSRLGNTITRFVYRLASGKSIYDTQTGLRAFSDSILPLLLDIPGDRYEYEMNTLMLFAKRGLPLREVAIETVYYPGNTSSHFDPLIDSARIYKEILKFSGVSFLSFLLDYMLYFIIISLSGSILLANLMARLVSAGFNYTINKKLVFKSDAKLSTSLTQYAALAIFIFTCNTLILSYLAKAGISVYIAKLMTEIIMFFVSYFIQHRFIFQRKGGRYEKA